VLFLDARCPDREAPPPEGGIAFERKYLIVITR
jgi:hypothetical protein